MLSPAAKPLSCIGGIPSTLLHGTGLHRTFADLFFIALNLIELESVVLNFTGLNFTTLFLVELHLIALNLIELRFTRCTLYTVKVYQARHCGTRYRIWHVSNVGTAHTKKHIVDAWRVSNVGNERPLKLPPDSSRLISASKCVSSSLSHVKMSDHNAHIDARTLCHTVLLLYVFLQVLLM